MFTMANATIRQTTARDKLCKDTDSEGGLLVNGGRAVVCTGSHERPRVQDGVLLFPVIPASRVNMLHLETVPGYEKARAE